MTFPDHRPPLLVDESALPALFGQLELQIAYMTDSIKMLAARIEKSDEERSQNWLEYVKAHSGIVIKTEDNAKHLTDLEIAVNKINHSTAESLRQVSLENSRSIQQVSEGCAQAIKLISTETHDRMDMLSTTTAKNIRDIDDKVQPLLFMHKILVGVALFFGTSVGALIWAIITHAITIVPAK